MPRRAATCREVPRCADVDAVTDRADDLQTFQNASSPIAILSKRRTVVCRSSTSERQRMALLKKPGNAPAEWDSAPRVALVSREQDGGELRAAIESEGM